MNNLPGPRYGHRIEGKNLAETWLKIIHRMRRYQGLIHLMAIVTEEREFSFPNYLPIDPQLLSDYAALTLENPRLRSWFGRDQIKQVINKLSSDLNSSQSVMSLWDVNSDHQSDDPPCLNHIWVRVVDNELSLTATFRCHEMYFDWLIDAIALLALQQYLKERIGTALTSGPLITVNQDAYLKEESKLVCDLLLETEYVKLCKQRDFDDPSGSFLISIKDNQLLVEQITPGSGEVVNCFSGKSACQLYQQIAADCPSLQVEHALYLGTELQKAEMALLNPCFTYTQDRRLTKKD